METTVDTLEGKTEIPNDARVRFWIDDKRFVEVFRNGEALEIYTSHEMAVWPHVTNRLRVTVVDPRNPA